MGARIEAREGRFPPFTVHGAPLTGIEYELPVASGQVKSCVLLAGLVTDATTVSSPSRAATTPSGCWPPPALRSRARRPVGGGFRTTVGNTDELDSDRRRAGTRPRRRS